MEVIEMALADEDYFLDFDLGVRCWSWTLFRG